MTALLAVLVVNFNEPEPVAAAVVPPPPAVLSAEYPVDGKELSAPSDEALEVEQEDALTAEAEAMATSTTTTTTTAPPEAPATTGQQSGSSDSASSGSSGSGSSAPATTAPPQTTPTTQAPAPPPSGSYSNSMESDFHGRINSLRSSNGLPGLTANGSLASYARSWAKTMAERGSLSHSNIGSLVPPWSSVAENVGKGSSVSVVWGALAGSGSHLANMLGNFTHVGVGVWVDANGTVWTVHVFAR